MSFPQDPLPRPIGISRGCLLGYSVGFMIGDMIGAYGFTYELLFLKTVERLSTGSAGVVFFAGQIVDALATALAGTLGDHSAGVIFLGWSLGPRKMGHFVGSSIMAVALYCFFRKSFFPNGMATLYYCFGNALINIGYAAAQVNHVAMVPELSDLARDQLLLINGRYAFGVVSNLAVFVLFLCFVQLKPPANKLNGSKFGDIAVTIVAFGMACVCAFQVLVPEPIGTKKDIRLSRLSSRPPSPIAAAPNSSDLRRSSDWLKLPAFYQVGYILMTAKLFTNFSQAYLPLYCLSVLQLEKISLGTVPMVLYLSSLAYSNILERTQQSMGRFNSFNLGCTYVLCAAALLGVATQGSSWLVYVAACLLGAGSAACLVAAVAMQADVIGDNIEGAGFVVAAHSVADKLSSGITVLVVQVLQQPLEDNSATDPCSNAACSKFLRGAVVAVPICCAASAMAVVFAMRVLGSLKAPVTSDLNTSKITETGLEASRGDKSVRLGLPDELDGPPSSIEVVENPMWQREIRL